MARALREQPLAVTNPCVRGVDVVKGTCSVEGCAKPTIARSMCGMHYKRWQIAGGPAREPRPTPLDQFWMRVQKSDEGCWLWTGYRDRHGYGYFTMKRRTRAAHITSYESLVGAVPEGLELDHLCRNHSCVRPDHLEPVTHAENVRRGNAGRANAAKTRCPQGHPYDEANTYINATSGGRLCRICQSKAKKAWRKRQATPAP